VYPKAVYPENAYCLDNGVCVCADCHQPIVHSTRESWRKFTGFFKRYARYARNRKFNAANQLRVCRENKHHE